MLFWIVNSRHTLRLTSPGTCVLFDLQLSTFDCSSSNSFTSFSLRTLSSLFASRVFTNSFEITQIRILLQNTRDGVPSPRSIFVFRLTIPRKNRIYKSLVFYSLRALPSSVSLKSFICHSLAPREIEGYENNGAVYQLIPFWNSALAPIRSRSARRGEHPTRCASPESDRGGSRVCPDLSRSGRELLGVTVLPPPVPLHQSGHSARM